ncbi:hypothetical protein HF289_14910 [Acidithiobacillus ferrooxidans]|jgi:hypothetical protein|uniref:hypothetical protein n=1 Tax=Acidithiobacillus ferrooxidans TaxID=920 RepID=UPI001C07A529|nr:hypothetical protein [Acidithiobacillus ferrooxidans]MBU2858085.1 hypothetical protein [Acidithiobacillus ferrooxidans]MBU2860664.1 hypothetical protein [Acidithiobacillus ferrooxidans]
MIKKLFYVHIIGYCGSCLGANSGNRSIRYLDDCEPAGLAQTCRSQGYAGAICDNFHHTEIKAMEVSCANNDEERVEHCAVPVAYLDLHLELVR